MALRRPSIKMFKLTFHDSKTPVRTYRIPTPAKR